MGLVDRLVVTFLPLVPRFVVGKVAARYVAGATLDEALATSRALEREGALTTLDLLGEEVRERAPAEEAVAEYLRAIAAIRDAGLPANVSVKPTQLGLQLDAAFCRANFERLVDAAIQAESFVRLDMEDRTTTDATLELYRHLHARVGPRAVVTEGYAPSRYRHCGVVLQAYMRRTRLDVDGLPAEGANVRLCKGIYIEPRTAAWKERDVVRSTFVAALEKLLRRRVYVGIATHDEYLVARAVELVDRLGIERDRYEFQMLLGVEDELRRILIAEGHRLRVYVPYGRDWYLYSMRRLRENPAVAGHVLRAFLRRR